MKNTFLKQVEINSAGGIRLSAYKQFLDGDTLTFEEPHLITIGPLDDFDAVISANNDHLAAMGYPPIPTDQLALATSLRTTAFADPLVSASIAALRAQAEQDAKDEAERAAAQEAARVAAEKTLQDAEAARQAQADADAEALSKANAERAEREAAAMRAAVDAAVAEALAKQPEARSQEPQPT